MKFIIINYQRVYRVQESKEFYEFLQCQLIYFSQFINKQLKVSFHFKFLYHIVFYSIQ
jgi:hypothetical protein